MIPFVRLIVSTQKSKYKEVTSRTALSRHNDSTRLSGRWVLRFSTDPYLLQNLS